MEEVITGTQRASSGFSEKIVDNPADAVEAVFAVALESSPLADMANLPRGIDEAFVQNELRLWQSIVSGIAIEHHLELSYFAALRKADQEKIAQ